LEARRRRWDITSRYVIGGKEEKVGQYIKVCDWRQGGEGGSRSHSRYFTNSFTTFYFFVILCGSIVDIRRLKYIQVSSSSYICHGVGPLVDPFRSHVSRSLFKGLP
jgi:hypothetical protein